MKKINTCKQKSTLIVLSQHISVPCYMGWASERLFHNLIIIWQLVYKYVEIYQIIISNLKVNIYDHF